MFDDFLVRALVAGLGLAITAGPLGCFVIWRRMSYFGDTMAHSALLGVALAFLLDINLMLGVFCVAIIVSLSLIALQSRKAVSTDALLGILSHSALALGLVLVAFMTWVRFDLMGLLFGDILSVSHSDLLLIFGGGAAVLGIIVAMWRPLLAATVNNDLAAAEGLKPETSQLVLMLLMACVIAIAMKIVGILLITAMLIIPAATARWLSATPEGMAAVASIAGMISVSLGLWGSVQFDSPSGPSIVVAALLLFLAAMAAGHIKHGWLAGRK
ncbi:hypothetical protein E1162_03530 [Rhodobacteraceae bacterium RKSG542]|uniref:metal ABC transporter permease n=1 Tax=Pseudovibrio flavus TaxID=2529854 RepID=UPI0012BBD400|nr:metal ABC transporter permease [Pseudovibrio flavus]MTI16309.1 hypothetical protein [Pseudovibrio flavus]